MNPDLEKLQPYPFERLNKLLGGVSAPEHLAPIRLSIGEPQHAAPKPVLEVLHQNTDKLSKYPSTKGLDDLRQAIADWATRRFKLKNQSLTAERHVLPVNGTREALFAFTQAIVNHRDSSGLVLMPNPFYQIYEGAALLAGAAPHFLNCDKSNGFVPDFSQIPAETWQRCELLFICTPGNPTGATISLEQMQQLIKLSEEHDFVIASDECYSELYYDENTPPPGLLQACAEMGHHSYRRCVVFHSLSKRSNLPGLRSGFVAGDEHLIQSFLRYRTYHGCAMPLHHQVASIAAWSDEQHVIENRKRYREKFDAVTAILADTLDFTMPPAGFYLWPKTPIDDEAFTQGLFAKQHVTVLPGRYLARKAAGQNPGEDHVRMALVASIEQCVEAAERIRDFSQRITDN